MTTKLSSLPLAIAVLLAGHVGAMPVPAPDATKKEAPAPTLPAKEEPAAKASSSWTDFSWLTNWFKKSGKEEKPATSDTSTPAQVAAKSATDWLDLSWVKEKWKDADKYGQELKDKLAKVDKEKLTALVVETAKAVNRDDYATAATGVAEMDKVLGTNAIKDLLPVLKIRLQEGTEAATAALREFLNRPDVSEVEKKAIEGMIVSLETVDRRDVKGFLIVAICCACEQKFGQEYGRMYGLLIAAGLFGDGAEFPGLIPWLKDEMKAAIEKGASSAPNTTPSPAPAPGTP